MLAIDFWCGTAAVTDAYMENMKNQIWTGPIYQNVETFTIPVLIR